MEIPVKYWSVNQRKHVGSVEAVLNGYDAHVGSIITSAT